MKEPETPFPRHWLYYLILKYVVIAGAVIVTSVDRLSALSRLENGDDVVMTEPRPTFFGLRTHHLVMALVAILIAVALASNYHLW